MAKKQGVSNVVDGLVGPNQTIPQDTQVLLPTEAGTSVIVPKPRPKQGLSLNASNNIGNAWSSFKNAPKLPVDLARKGIQQNFNADLNHTQYERYYNHPDFKDMGFSPFRDNETHYNEQTSGWSDFQRTFAQWRSLAATGFTDAMSFGPSSDRKAAEKFERAMAIGSSTRGGVTGFTTNLFLNSGYTFGIIAEMLLEEAILYGVGLFTGGSTWGLATARGAAKINMIDNAWDLAKTVKGAAKTADALDDLKDINVARNYWAKMKGVGAWAGRKIAPDTAGVVKHWDDIKALGPLAQVNTTAASFYKDVRNIRLAYSESALEAGMVENELLDEFYQLAVRENGGGPLSDLQKKEISKRAKDASMTTFSQNFPTIWLSNQIVFDNLFHSFSPTRKLLGQPLKKNAAGKIVKEAGKTLNPYQVVGSNFRGTLKAFTKPRSYAKFGLNYFRANFAEGLQETAQEIISGAAKDYYRQDPKDPMLQGYHTMLASNIQKQVTPEGLEVFMSGFLMGGPVSMVTSTMSGAVDQVKKFRDPDYAAKMLTAKQELVTAAAEYNEFHADPMKMFDHNLENANAQKHYQEGMAEAKANGDKKIFYDLHNAAASSHVLNAIQGGMLGGFIERMEDYSTMTDEEIVEGFPNLKETPGAYKSKVGNMIKLAKSLEQDYKNYSAKFPAPTDPVMFKGNQVRYANARLKTLAWQNSMKQFLFMRHSFYNNFERQNGILQKAGSELTGQDLSGADFVSLFDSDKTTEVIQQKEQMLKNLGDVKQLKPTPEQVKKGIAFNEAEDFEYQTTEELEALKKFDTARSKYVSISNAPEHAVAREDAAQEWYQAYSELIGTMSKDVQFNEDIGESFQELLDYTDLGTEGQKVKEAVNFLLNPEQWELNLERNERAIAIGLENRIPFMKSLLEDYVDKMGKNALLKALFEEAGVFLDAEGIAAVEDGSFPQNFYDTLVPYSAIYKGSPKWATASKVIEDYIKNVKDKPIPESEGTNEFDVSTRDKLPGDNRTYDDLAEQFGFDPKSKSTAVSEKIVLQAIINSPYATEAEKLLAEQFLAIADDTSDILFVNNLNHPGEFVSNKEGGTVVIDARYSSEDYRNGNQPLEVILLHEETHRYSVNGLETDSAYKGKITEIMEAARKHFDETNKGLPLYGFKNEAEFVAETMSNPVFQQMLNEIPMEGPLQKNGWTAFVNAVVHFLESTFGKGKVDGSVLNAAMDVITAKIDSEFGGKKDFIKEGPSITPQTPVSAMPTSLQKSLLHAFDTNNESSRLLEARLDGKMEDAEVLEHDKFKNWMLGNPIVYNIIDKYNTDKAKETPIEPTKSKLRYVGKNPAVDSLVTREVDGETQVLLIKRGDYAVEGNKWALPGGFIDTDAQRGEVWTEGKETTLEAAVRELKEETGLDFTGRPSDDYTLGPLGVRDTQTRDPRNSDKAWVEARLQGLMIPEGMESDDVTGQDDAKEAKWFTAEELNNMADTEFGFDHADILVQQNLRTPRESKVGQLEVDVDVFVEASDFVIEGITNGWNVLAGNEADGVGDVRNQTKDFKPKYIETIKGDKKIFSYLVPGFIEYAAAGRDGYFSVSIAVPSSSTTILNDFKDALKSKADEIIAANPTKGRGKLILNPNISVSKPTQQTSEVEVTSVLTEKEQKLKEIRDEREALRKELDELRGLINPKAEGGYYFKQPALSYEEGLQNIQNIFKTIIKEYKTYDLEQVETMLTELGASDFVKAEYAKIKDYLIAAGVTMQTTLGEGVSETAFAAFSPQQNDILLNIGLLVADPRVETGSQIAQIIVHEMIHAATHYKVATSEGTFSNINNELPALSQREKEAVKDLQDVLKEIKREKVFADEYGITNVDEMLAELSNEVFVNKLKATTLRGKTLWEMLVDGLVKLFSKVTPEAGANAYAKVYSAYEVLLEQNADLQRDAIRETLKGAGKPRGNVFNNLGTAFEARKKESDLINDNVKSKERVQASLYKSEAKGVNLDKIRKQIAKLEDRLAQLDKQEEIVERMYDSKGPIIPETVTTITPDMRDTLEKELHYNRFDIRNMTPDEAMDIITEGLTKEAADQRIEEGIAESARKEAAERHDIRRAFDKMLESAETFEEMEAVKARAKEILREPGLVNISGYNAQELGGLIEQRKKELREHIDFDALGRGDQVYMYDNVNSKFVVVDKTANTVKLRKFGDILGPVFSVSRSKAQEKIKYMSNQFLNDAVLNDLEISPEEEVLIKNGVERAIELTDAGSIKEDIDNAKSKSDEDLKNDLRDELDQNCE